MSIDRLRAHYGFTKTPFGKDLAPGTLHCHDAHAQAVARIQWCISEQAIGVISGECGAGKTVAARAAVAGLDASRHTVLYLGTPGVGLRGIYGLIVTALGGTPRFHHASLIPQTQELLAAESAERGKRVLLIIDEAHLLDGDSLEGIRCLSNMGMDQTAPFGLLLLGQPTLRHRLRRGMFTALDQRVAVRYAIHGLDRAETTSYVQHHLALAGRSDTMFSDDAIELIHDVSRGLPRQVNNLAVAALIAAFAANKSIVDESAARAAVAEISAE
ncbi:MAG: ExeA family protein [Solirubrobacteraceae bacterium]